MENHRDISAPMPLSASTPQSNGEQANPPQPGFPPQQGYQPPQQEYPPQQGYQPPQPGYQPTQPGYQPAQPGYQPPQPGYQPPQQPQQAYHPLLPTNQPQPQPQQGYPQQPGVQVQQVYAQPILVPLNSNQVLFNQSCPTGTNTTIIYKRAPIEMVCPYCRQQIKTVVEDKCNGAACLFCCSTAFCVFAFLQTARGKDLLCCDSRHKCPKCRQFLGAYIAC